MPLNVKNGVVERLATEASRRQAVTKTAAVRRALEAHLENMNEASGAERIANRIGFLERDVRPFVPTESLGRPVTEDEREHIA